MPPRLFLSHSSKNATLTNDLATLLAQPTSTHPGYEVLVDVSCLAAGEEWPQQLHAMMAYAHAGLLLFTPEAIKSPWVLKEAYILTWRRSLDPTFKVFYALMNGVTPADVASAGFEPAHLKLIQALRSTTAQDIADEVRRLGPTAPSAPGTPLEVMRDKLAHLLSAAGNALSFLSIALGLPQLPWTPDAPNKDATQIAARLIQGQFGTVGGVKKIVDELISIGLPSSALKPIFKWIAPHWLAPEISGRFSAVVQDLWENQRGGFAAVGGDYLATYTALMLVDRSRPFDFGTRVARIELGSDSNDADYYTDQICDWVRAEDHDGDGDYGDNADVMKKLRTEPPSLFVPIAPVDPATLTTLRARFPNVVFLIKTRPVTASEGDVISLLPDIDTTREDAEYGMWRYARNAVRKISN